MYNYIAIEGNIGAGKTTLARQLAAAGGARLILEQFEDNSFLPKFYKEPERYAFPLEMSFLAARFNQLKKQLASRDLFSDQIIADYCIFKSLIFSKITLGEDEYNLYLRLFEIIDLQLPRPDLIVYLYRPVSRLLYQIQKRGRTYEEEIPPDYLEKIHEGYLEYLRSMPAARVLIIEIDGMDYENNPADFTYLQQLIQREYAPGLHKIR